METSEILTFGRYTGRTTESVWTGINPFDDHEVINKYLFELCSFLLNINDIEEIPSSKFNLSDHGNEIIFFSQSNTSKAVIVDDYKIQVRCSDDNISIALFEILSNILSESFKTIPQYYIKRPLRKSIGHSINSIRFQLLQADPLYIKWCIENLDFFFFTPNDFRNMCAKSCRYLSRFELSKIDENTIQCFPIFQNNLFDGIDLILAKNQEKYLEKQNNDRLFRDNGYDSDIVEFCAACHELPCVCSDREESSTIYDF